MASNDGQKSTVKRKLELTGVANNQKVRRSSQTSANDTDSKPAKKQMNIMEMSDDAFYVLFTYVSSTDLCNLMQVHPRFAKIIGHRTFWRDVEIECDGLTPNHAQVLQMVHSDTQSIIIKNRSGTCNTAVDISPCLNDLTFQSLKDSATTLKTFMLQNHRLTLSLFQLQFLPHSITQLRLPNCTLSELNSVTNWFSGISLQFPSIELVDLSYNDWFTSHAFLPLAKCQTLKTLILKGCIFSDLIPYASVAASLGFKKLETLDLRLTNITDRELACFNQIGSLKNLYLEKPCEDSCTLIRAPPFLNAGSNSDHTITDLGITTFGFKTRDLNPEEDEIVPLAVPQLGLQLRMARMYNGNTVFRYGLERLIVRNYRCVSQLTLLHASACMPCLKVIDVTGTSCTRQQGLALKYGRPEVRVFVNNVEVELPSSSFNNPRPIFDPLLFDNQEPMFDDLLFGNQEPAFHRRPPGNQRPFNIRRDLLSFENRDSELDRRSASSRRSVDVRFDPLPFDTQEPVFNRRSSSSEPSPRPRL